MKTKNVVALLICIFIVIFALSYCPRRGDSPIMQEHSNVMQAMRYTSDQLNRDVPSVVINSNPGAVQAYFQIRQATPEQSVLRFFSTTVRGLIEVGYQIQPNTNDWENYDLRRMHRTNMSIRTNETNWPLLNFSAHDVEPFARTIIGFVVEYWGVEEGKWIRGDWDSMKTGTMPKRIRVTLTGITRAQAKDATAKKLQSIKDMKTNETEVQIIELTLPCAR